MLVRRPRIKSAVNLAALAGGRRKDKPEETETFAKNEPAEEHQAVPNVDASKSKAVSLEISSNLIDGQSEDLDNVIDNSVEAEKEATEARQKVPAVASDDVNELGTKSSHTDGTGLPEPQAEQAEIVKSDVKSIESPFSPPPPGRPAIGRFKSRFRPNLSETRHRNRTFSGNFSDLGSPPPYHGSPSKKVRTLSCSSTSESEQDHEHLKGGPTQEEVLMKKPPTIQRISVLNEVSSPPHTAGSQDSFAKVLSPESDVKTNQAIHRQRRVTEARDSTDSIENRDPTVFEMRKADYKKKFHTGIPERGQLTMFDLIYYNPSSGSRMSNSSSARSSRAASRASSVDVVVRNEAAQLEAVRRRLEEEAVDDVEGVNEDLQDGSDEQDDAMPVPQVKVGPDGNIIIDESSTMIETTAAKKAKEDYLKAPLVFENETNTNYGSWCKRKKTADWTEKETVRFFKALSIFGTDFSMMENIFKRRSRHELKMKYKKEERQNRALVDKCLTQGLQFDSTILESEEDDEEEEAAPPKKKAKQTRKAKEKTTAKRKTGKRKKNRRGYYASSDEDEAEKDGVTVDEEDGHQHAEVRQPRNDINAVLSQGIEVPVSQPFSSHQTESNLVIAEDSPSGPLLKSLLTQPPMQQTSGFAFPPALLAANPSLASAAPGSLVVVASPAPSGTDPNSQILQIFVVGEDQELQVQGAQEGPQLQQEPEYQCQSNIPELSEN